MTPERGITVTMNDTFVHIVQNTFFDNRAGGTTWRVVCKPLWMLPDSWRGRVYGKPATCLMCIGGFVEGLR